MTVIGFCVIIVIIVSGECAVIGITVMIVSWIVLMLLGLCLLLLLGLCH